MSPSHNRVRRVTGVRRPVASALAIGMLGCSISPSQAEVLRAAAGKLVDSVINFLRRPAKSSKRADVRVKPRQIDNAAPLTDRITGVRLCPRRLLLYVGEQFTLVPLPLDLNKAVVHGIAFGWESSDGTVADVASDGSVTALKSGICTVTASVGNQKGTVNIEVRDGPRPFLTNAQWDVEHVHDCDDPEQSPAATNARGGVAASRVSSNSHKGRIRPAVVRDPDDPPNVGGAGNTANATGDMRFTPAEVTQGAAGKAKNQLGSSNFGLTIPIFDSPGRGVGASVALIYNSRPWTKDGNKMVFDYDQGWPAPGFRLNYGRIIPNYDAPVGFSLGNYLLIEADGTRTPLVLQSGTTTIYRSNDGRFIDFDSSSSGLSYPDGTVVFYISNGSKLVPNLIRDINGNSISITYVDGNAGACSDAQRVEPCDCNAGCIKPPRQAINYIRDTLGRLVTFYYKADGNLAEIRVAGYNGAADRTVAKFSYQSLTLAYNFGTMTVINVPVGNQVDVLRRVYFPDTGRGYIFEPYSGYGMCTKVSMRLGMTDPSDGTEVAFSEYLYQTTGVLSDSPQFTERHEWWQGKTDDSGALQDSTHPAIFTYGRTADNSSNWVIAPNGVKSESLSNSDSTSSQFGLVTTQRVIRTSDAKVLSQQDFTYNDRSSTTGLQRTIVITTDDAGNQTKVLSIFGGTYGRLAERVEYGFGSGGVFNKRRRTVYTYLDDVNYLNLSLRQLVTDISVYDAKGSNDNGDDVLIARSGFVYDTPDAGWEMETYGFTQNCGPPACSPPPGFATNRINRVQRGNVTKLQLWSDATATTAQINFRRRYDIFGNQLKAEVGCCSLKSSEFRDAPTTSPGTSAMYWSAPFTATDGAATGPNLTTTFAYDFNTSFLNSQTDPNSLVTSYTPDAAMRLRTVTYPKLATDTNANPTLETFYVDVQDNPSSTDTLAYQSRFTYFDGSTQKVQVSNLWLDGTGRAVRSGSASGPTVASFDAVKSIYDDLGRLRKSTNPYNTTNADGNTTGLPNATVYDYDSLSRVVTVTLPDANTVTTSYSGAVATVTDQVGRQRKSEVDGLGRVVTVTEQDPVSGSLTLATNYTYDLLNNLTAVDQGGQTRGFSYDSLSRMTTETTPEGGSVSFTYTDFGAVLKRTDARTVETHYHYDSLNRLDQVWYTGPNGLDDPNATRPPLPAGVAPTADVTVSYNTAAPGNGGVSRIDDGAGFETYAYDSLGRTISKIRMIDSRSYQTQYQYNQASQLSLLIYPSGKRVRMNFDSRGRLSGEDNVDGANNVLTSYVSLIGYNEAGQVTGLSLGNGVNETYGYSADRLQLTSQTAAKGTTSLVNLKYIYQTAMGDSGVGTTANNSGQLMMISGTIGPQSRTQRFKYDDLGRLVSALGKGRWEQSYSYDRWGNRKSVHNTISNQDIQTVTLQPQQGAQAGVPNNQIATVNGFSYSYDPSGNLTADEAHNYQYDAESRLVTVDANTASSVYDSSNRRVKKTAGGITTHYVWEGNQVIAEYNGGTGALISEYVFAGNRMVSREQSGTLRYFLQDRLSTRLITDSSGNLVGREDHLPFGEDAGTGSGETEKHRFTSYVRDNESGSDYAINRQYSNSTGRFMRPDPVAGKLSNPQSLNRYGYTANDPINLIDPDGQVLAFPILTGLINFFDSLVFAYVVQVTAQPFLPRDGGGDSDIPRVFFGTRSRECEDALRTAYGAGQAAVTRAAAGYSYVRTAASAHGIDPAILTAIGVRETGFRNIRETNASGGGRGIFQIDVGYHPDAVNIAFDPPRAADYAAGLLEGSFSRYADRGYGLDTAIAAAVHDYNSSPAHTLAALRNEDVVAALNQSTTGHNYVSNVLNLARHCFSNPTYFTDTPISGTEPGLNGG